jgi:hypothetical protein
VGDERESRFKIWIVKLRKKAGRAPGPKRKLSLKEEEEEGKPVRI